jgi:hypothetical protein
MAPSVRLVEPPGMAGGTPLPTAPVAITLSPSGGDVRLGHSHLCAAERAVVPAQPVGLPRRGRSDVQDNR